MHAVDKFDAKIVDLKLFHRPCYEHMHACRAHLRCVYCACGASFEQLIAAGVVVPSTPIIVVRFFMTIE